MKHNDIPLGIEYAVLPWHEQVGNAVPGAPRGRRSDGHSDAGGRDNITVLIVRFDQVD